MRHHIHNPLSRDQAYADYYINQCGSGLSIYHGARSQRGHGLGSIFSGLFKPALPMIKSGLGYLGRQAVKTGAQVLGDVIDGRSFGDAAKARSLQTIKETLPLIIEKTEQTGSGKCKRQQGRSKSRKKRPKICCNVRDIFDQDGISSPAIL